MPAFAPAPVSPAPFLARLLALACATLVLVAGGAPARASDVPRPEHPQPRAVRDAWLNLNGTWEFDFDDENKGLDERWFASRRPFSRSIVVPFPFQAPLSGIGDPGVHHVVWYRRTFTLPDSFAGGRTLLRFGAVDYTAQVWVNGTEAGSHRGGHVPFAIDATRFLRAGTNEIVVRAEDTEDPQQPRGKQYWQPKPVGIWYTRTSGIWQTVWLERVGRTYIRDFRATPSLEAEALDVEIEPDGDDRPFRVRAVVTIAGEPISEIVAEPGATRFSVPVPDPKLWSPESPHLYDLVLSLVEAEGEAPAALDEVRSYFGMRKVSIEGNRFLLNGRPYYQRLVLDQGYWPEGILTPPSDEAMRYDIEMARAFGFNGARKHQKIEDPRWLYWADKLGFLVWGEMPSAAPRAAADERARDMFREEWRAAVRRDRNHPSVVVWTPFNESWGLPGVRKDPAVQDLVAEIYALTKAEDPSRPVCDNSGWEHVRTDVADIHNYAPTGEDFLRQWNELLARNYGAPEKGFAFFADGTSYSGQPIVIGEYGGIGLKVDSERVIGSETKAWSYGKSEEDVEAYLARYRSLTETIQNIPEIQGFCYTQLTDVEHEVNGLMTYDRKPKLDPARVAEINLRRVR